MTDLVVSVPPKRVSAWSVETNPKYARAWLASLLPVDNTDSARELYQSLYTLNRMELEAGKRFALMELYREPIQEAIALLQALFGHMSFPLPTRMRQLAEFVCQLHLEMAHGYKLCIYDLSRHWLPWRRRQLLLPCGERALYHLGEVLLRSYQRYLPYPAGVWRDAHALYRFVERYGRQDEIVKVEENRSQVSISISQRYRRLLLLGIANPYQMPYNECVTVYRFLGRWIEQVRVDRQLSRSDNAGCFLIDPKTEAPPAPLGRLSTNRPTAELRVLDASELVRTLHIFLRRLDKGETAGELQLGIECLDSACHDILQRLHRAYAQSTSRRHSRIKRHETVSICAGIGALHFFISGQRPLMSGLSMVDAPFRAEELVAEPHSNDESRGGIDGPDGRTQETPIHRPLAHDVFRIDRWQVRDVSPEGLLLAQDGEPNVRFRVGDALGIQRITAVRHWSIGIVRWFKAQGGKGVEVGVELIAPDAVPLSLRLMTEEDLPWVPALLLPALGATHRPASLLAPRGALQVGKDLFLSESDRPIRRVRVLDTIERTGSIEQVIFGNVIG